MQSSGMIGNIEPYVIGENIESWLEMFKYFTKLNKIIDDETKVLLLINVIGKSASIKIIRACNPKDVDEFSYAEIIQKCRDLFCHVETPQDLHNFNTRVQKEGESLTEFADALEALADKCHISESRDFDLKTRFLIGMKNTDFADMLIERDENWNTKKFYELVLETKIEESVYKPNKRTLRLKSSA
jgi:hypothetical protein